MGTTKGEGQFCNGGSATFTKKYKTIVCHYSCYLLLYYFLVFEKDLPLPFNLQSLAKHSRSNIGAEGGPPPFVPFGQVRMKVIMKLHFSKTL